LILHFKIVNVNVDRFDIKEIVNIFELISWMILTISTMRFKGITGLNWLRTGL